MIVQLSRGVRVAAILLAAGGVLPALQPSAGLVSVDVLVTDKEGAPVPGLVRDAFQVVADEQERTIVSVTPGRKPLDLILLLDLTASMSDTLHPNALVESVEGLIDSLQDAERLRIGGFARDLILNNGLSADRRRLRSEMRTATSHRRENLYGPSPIWDATYRAIESFPESGARRAIILFTDGRATGNVRTLDEVAKAAMLRRVSINIVGLDVSVQVRQSETNYVAVRPGTALQWLADVTGGRFISATGMLRPVGPLLAVLENLRHVYTLTFEAPPTGDTPKVVRVHVRRPGLIVRARSLYMGSG